MNGRARFEVELPAWVTTLDAYWVVIELEWAYFCEVCARRDGAVGSAPELYGVGRKLLAELERLPRKTARELEELVRRAEQAAKVFNEARRIARAQRI